MCDSCCVAPQDSMYYPYSVGSMGKPKFSLCQKKNSGSPAYRKRVGERNVRRQVRNASLKYDFSPSDVQNCHVAVPLMNVAPDGRYQQISVNGHYFPIKRPVVVSLFDGISAGLVALKSLGIIPDTYYSSEIDEDALRIQRFNFGANIHQLGDVRGLQYETLRNIAPDILFGGSPCSDLSRVNPNRKGIEGEDGSGPLFFEFLRVLLFFKHAAQLSNRGNEFFWFFENTRNLDIETCSAISMYLGCEPMTMCSSMFVPMTRQRYFWTNIPLCKDKVEAMYAERKSSYRGRVLQDYLCGSGRTANIKTLPTFTSNLSNLVKGGMFPVTDDTSGPGHLFYSEIETIFGFPIHYTAGPNTPLHIRKKVLAKTWDVHTIKYILEPLIMRWKC
ncbi:DNA (cytosine-5)-methyltransferase 3B [Frankliniella fusca]|uniref:DNA (cytosine-5-)-methyltransferase n=1 Tax=Frankliniella fusca TaxID=407009 RepID=A0AAE1LG94_9NEOP|nr:DNA (cytosine-5)-methyltransferase 3B [Frankliniella fusca]